MNDESSVFYVNDELADELGLSATYEKIVVTISEINDTLKRFWEKGTLSIQENGVQGMTREEKIALDKTLLSLVHGEHYQACTAFS